MDIYLVFEPDKDFPEEVWRHIEDLIESELMNHPLWMENDLSVIYVNEQ